MAQEKKRIGLVLASIHTGISLNVWDSFARTASNENTSLFIFPGGRLNAFQNYENLRNQIYTLANSDNLDGCISWSSSIRYKQQKEGWGLRSYLHGRRSVHLQIIGKVGYFHA